MSDERRIDPSRQPGPLDHAYRYCPHCRADMEISTDGDTRRPACTACGYVQYLNPSPAAAVIIRRGRKICLVKRRWPPRQGQWTLPAGFMEYTEDSPANARREVREETGLEVELTGLFGVDSGILPPDRPVLLITWLARETGGALRAGDDASEAGFYDLDDLPGPIAFGTHRRILDRLREEDR